MQIYKLSEPFSGAQIEGSSSTNGGGGGGVERADREQESDPLLPGKTSFFRVLSPLFKRLR